MSVKTEEFKSSLSSFLNALHSIFEKASKAPDVPYANTEKIIMVPSIKEPINFLSLIPSTETIAPSATISTSATIATLATTASNLANIRPTTNSFATITKLSSKTKSMSSTDTESIVTEIPSFDLILPDACLCSMNDLPKIEGLSKWDCDDVCNCLPKCFSGKIIPEEAVCSRVSKMLHRSYFGSDPGKTYALAGDQHLHFPRVKKKILNTQNV